MYTNSSIYADVLELPFYVPPRYAQTGADFAFKSGVQMAAVRAMIKAVFIINNAGKPRLSKFYEYLDDDTQQRYLRECYNLIVRRDDALCNFLEGGPEWGKDTRLIYRCASPPPAIAARLPLSPLLICCATGTTQRCTSCSASTSPRASWGSWT